MLYPRYAPRRTSAVLLHCIKPRLAIHYLVYGRVRSWNYRTALLARQAQSTQPEARIRNGRSWMISARRERFTYRRRPQVYANSWHRVDCRVMRFEAVLTSVEKHAKYLHLQVKVLVLYTQFMRETLLSARADPKAPAEP